MPNKNTPAKHKTPNYRLVSHDFVVTDIWGRKHRVVTSGTWEPMPLRADRKDLRVLR